MLPPASLALKYGMVGRESPRWVGASSLRRKEPSGVTDASCSRVCSRVVHGMFESAAKYSVRCVSCLGGV